MDIATSSNGDSRGFNSGNETDKDCG